MNFTVTKHPNPQFERKNIEILNGQWDFGFKKAKRGFKFSDDEKRAIEVREQNEYTHKINVPFWSGGFFFCRLRGLAL